MSTKRFHETYSTSQQMGTNGRPACLECKSDITEKRRRTFCGKVCADSFRVRTSPDHARFMVFQRDKGVCAKCLKNVFDGTGRKPRARGTGDLWQADHIVPVIEGGGECGLENYRTLCTRCHKEETALLAKRRAEARRLITPQVPLPLPLDTLLTEEDLQIEVPDLE